MIACTMIDLETLGTKAGAAILSIGACHFDLETGEVSAQFYHAVDLDSCTEAGLKVDPNTVRWWETQSKEARAVFTDPDRVPLTAALDTFKAFMAHGYSQSGNGKLLIYANDPDFDCVILDHALTVCNKSTPWPFWMSRSCRTTLDFAKRLKGFDAKTYIERHGTYHNALDDALYQAALVSACYAALGQDSL